MPQPTLTCAETELTLIKKLQDDNTNLRNRLQAMGIGSNQSNSSITSTNPSTSHQSRFTTFNNDQQQSSSSQSSSKLQTIKSIQQLSDITPFDISPPNHLVDDFYIIAQESLNTSSLAESQGRGLKSLIRNIGGSPVMGRKESLDRSKRRSGSANKM